MAVLTAAATYRESVGSMTLNIVTFASVTTTGDTWTIPTIYPGLWAWAVGTTANAASATVTGGIDVNIATSGTGTVFTLAASRVANPVTLFILART